MGYTITPLSVTDRDTKNALLQVTCDDSTQTVSKVTVFILYSYCFKETDILKCFAQRVEHIETKTWNQRICDIYFTLTLQTEFHQTELMSRHPLAYR